MKTGKKQHQFSSCQYHLDKYKSPDDNVIEVTPVQQSPTTDYHAAIGHHASRTSDGVAGNAMMTVTSSAGEGEMPADYFIENDLFGKFG